MAHVISMEQSLPTKDESKNDGETSHGHHQTVVLTDVMEIFIEEGPSFEIQEGRPSFETREQTSPKSDWDLDIPMELRSFLDDRGHPIVNNTQNSWLFHGNFFPKVPLRLRKKPRSEDYFDPMVISFGPYHHDKLQEIDTIKTEAMLKFIKESGKPFQEFYYKVHHMNNYNRDCYVDCSEEKYCDETFALIMLRDGCFISYLLDRFVHEKEEDVLSLFVNHGNFLGFNSALRDMVMLENQIPFAVLELLMSLRYNNNNKVVPKMIKQYIFSDLWDISPKEVPEDKDEGPQAKEPHHLLECIQIELSKVVDRKKERTHCFSFVPLYRFCLWNPFPKASKKEQNLANDDKKEQNPADEYPSYRSLSELKAKGIHFKPNSSPHSLRNKKSFSFYDVEFIPGFFYAQLKLPPLILDYETTILWNNLVAFELSHPMEVDVVITSYINFLNAFVANPDDVKELRSKRILLNEVGSDEEMFKFLKEIYTGSIQDRSIYRKVRQDIEEHCRSKISTWAAEIIYKYFRNPWSALGLFAAVTVVVLSFVQTYFTIYPVKD